MFVRMLIKLRECRNGTTAIEYALIAGIVALAIIATVGLVGNNLTTLFAIVEAGFSS